MRYSNPIYLILIVFFLSIDIGIIDAKNTDIKTENSCPFDIEFEQDDTPWLTFFVHGIISVKPYLNLPNVVKFVQDKIVDTPYAKMIELTRNDPFFYQYHPMQKPGLYPIDLTDKSKGAAATAYALIFDSMYQEVGKTNNFYYTLGWSGLLSSRMREIESTILYDQLLQEIQRLNKNNQHPKVRVIAYSHGGNVILKLGEIYESRDSKDQIIIDELILIGVPLLPETDYLINSPLFKKIYHFYSYGDRIQRLDCFSMSRLFSNRIFHERSGFSLPDKLVQINIKMKRPTKGTFKEYTVEDERISAVRNHRHSRTADPGHSELWSFAWVPNSFRKTFPLYPLPFAICCPYIIGYLEKLPFSNHVSIELNTAYERMIIYDFNKKQERIIPFIAQEKQEELKLIAYDHKPGDDFTLENYDNRIEQNKKKANEDWILSHNTRQRARFYQIPKTPRHPIIPKNHA